MKNVEGLNRDCDVDFLLDKSLVHRLKIEGPKKVGGEWRRDDTLADANLKKRFQATAGPHKVGVTFPTTGFSLLENRRQPFEPSFNRHRHPRREPAIFEVSIVGPFANPSDKSDGSLSTPSRKQIFVSYPSSDDTAEASKCAKEILERITQRAYRRSITEADLEVPMQFFNQRFAQDGFEAAIESAITAVLVNPHFLFRAEGRVSGGNGEYAEINSYELATRMSYFLWSSLPDEELHRAAREGLLGSESGLKQQTLRMLADPKAQSLVNNFAAQWLYLRNLDSLRPDMRLFPNFDDNLRNAMRRETELHFERMLRDDRSVLDLIQTDTTFLNDRLAMHYEIPHVQGSHFRPVTLENESARGGLLRQASILSVTSYATRTSPTIRGNWILENILGTPPPPPPPNVPSLKEKSEAANATVRERLRQHREDPACASCHNLMDPVGFALENYDAVGKLREYEDESRIDSTGALPDGLQASNVAELEAGILKRPEMFVATMTEKLLTFGLGRGVDEYDAPAIRKIVREAAEDDYKFSSIIVGIVQSRAFRMRSRTNLSESARSASKPDTIDR